jgi:hypothetical protein
MVASITVVFVVLKREENEEYLSRLKTDISDIKKKDKNAKWKIQIMGIALRDFFIEDFRKNYQKLNFLIDSSLENNLRIEAFDDEYVAVEQYHSGGFEHWCYWDLSFPRHGFLNLGRARSLY